MSEQGKFVSSDTDSTEARTSEAVIMHYPTLNPAVAVAAVAFLSAVPTVQAGMYTKNSPVLQVDAKNYDRLIAKSNYTSVGQVHAMVARHLHTTH